MTNRHTSRKKPGRNLILFFVVAPLPFFLYLVLSMHFGIMVELETIKSLSIMSQRQAHGGVSAIAWDIDDAPALRKNQDTSGRRSLNMPSGDLSLRKKPAAPPPKNNIDDNVPPQESAKSAVSNKDNQSVETSKQNQSEVKTQADPVEKANANNNKSNSKKNKPLAIPSRIPNVLLAGVQKSGTTAIASWIFHLHNTCKPANVETGEPIKEAHFFNNDDRFAEGIKTYEKHFQHCTKDNTIWLDATPNYFPHADRVREIYNAAGGTYAQDLKIIFIVREPVQREFSWYNHMVADSNDPKTKKYARNVLDESGKVISFDRYVKNTVLVGWEGLKTSFGRYAKWLEKWMNKFDRQQILVLNYDELLNDPESVTKRLRNFLNLSKKDGADGIVYHNKKANAKKLAAPMCQAQDNLAKEYEQENQKLYKLLEKNPGPEAEQRPFAKFKLSYCNKEPEPTGDKTKGNTGIQKKQPKKKPAEQAASIKKQ